MPKISIIVPVYNAENTIERCTKSLMGQTFHDIEIIFIDDCSKDDSLKILSDIVKDDERCKLLHNNSNMGSSFTRHKGLNEATGDYVIACDSDDWVTNDFCEKLFLYTNNGNTDIVWCDIYKKDGNNWITTKQLPAKVELIINEEITNLLLNRRQGSLCNHLVRRKLYRAVMEYPKVNMAEDLALLLQLYLSANSIAYVPQPLYYYDYSPQSLSHVSATDADKRLVKQARDMEENVRLLERCFKKKGVYDKFREEFVFRKFFNKRWMLPALHSFSDCKIWRNIHSEVNLRLFGNKYISKADKFTALLCILGVYPLIRKVARGR